MSNIEKKISDDLVLTYMNSTSVKNRVSTKNLCLAKDHKC